jgi:hypothetical protein
MQNGRSVVAHLPESITPEQALSNVLAVFFAGMPNGHFFGAQDGTAPIPLLANLSGRHFVRQRPPDGSG